MYTPNQTVIYTPHDIPNGIEAVIRHRLNTHSYIIEIIDIGSVFGTYLQKALSSQLTPIK